MGGALMATAIDLTATALTTGAATTSALLGTSDGVKPSVGDIINEGVDIAPPNMGTNAALDGTLLIPPAAVRICAALGVVSETQMTTAIRGLKFIVKVYQRASNTA